MINLLGSDVSGSSHSIPMDTPSVVVVDQSQRNCDHINKQVRQINKALDRIDEWDDIRVCSTGSRRKDAVRQIEFAISEVHGLIRSTKRSLDGARSDLNNETQPTKKRIARNVLDYSLNKFSEATHRFGQTVNDFQKSQKEDVMRRAKIINPDLTNQQAKQMICAQRPAEYLQQQSQMTQAHVSREVLQEMRELEQESRNLHRLEQTMGEIQDLVNTTAMLVAESGQKLDDVEFAMEGVEERAMQGTRHIQHGERYVRNTRSTKMKTAMICVCCLIFAVLVILGMLGFVIRPFTGK